MFFKNIFLQWNPCYLWKVILVGCSVKWERAHLHLWVKNSSSFLHPSASVFQPHSNISLLGPPSRILLSDKRELITLCRLRSEVPDALQIATKSCDHPNFSNPKRTTLWLNIQSSQQSRCRKAKVAAAVTPSGAHPLFDFLSTAINQVSLLW